MERITRVRAVILLVLFLGILTFFGLKLYDLQVIQTEGNTDNTTYYTVRYRVRASRGDLLDTNGNPLVSNRASYDLVFNKYVITSSPNPNESILKLVQLCKEMGIEYIDHFPVTETRPFEYTLDEYSSAWQGYFQKYLASRSGGLDSDISAPLLIEKLRKSYYIPEDWSDEDARLVLGVRFELSIRGGDISNLPNYVFVEDATDEELAAILELNIPGLTTEASTVREYNTDLAAHILGYTGAMTKEQWEYYKDIDGYEMDSVVGQSGLELAFEEQLHGTDGIREDKVTKDGTLVSSEMIVEPKAGNHVQVSIDLNLQRAAENALAEKIEELRATGEDDSKADGSDVTGGAAVVMDIKTGQVLACASYPTYNLATFRQDYDTLKEDPYAPMFNRALQAVYPPGSTYKVSMTVAGMESGTITANTIIETQGIFTKYTETDPSFHPACLIWYNTRRNHGNINCVTALEKSCNYFFYELADRMWTNGTSSFIDNTAKAMGLGEPTGIELGERTGHRANAETKKQLYTGSAAIWYQGDQILAAIGQSDNLFSPMQLCVYASTLANKGTRYRATFLNRVVSSDYRSLIEENQPEIVSTLSISEATYKAYLEGMKRVALSGSAKSTFSNYPISIACKTGTADTDKSQYAGASPNAAFICFAPADDPQIAIAVYGEQAGYGSYMAGVARAVLDVYFDVGEVGEINSYENQVG